MIVLDLDGITKTYLGDPPVTALRGVDLTITSGERVAILGRSGAGKSTLLNVVGLLDEPTSGTYLLNGQDMSRAHTRERDRLRATMFGFVFQESHVLGQRTVSQNVWLGLMAAGVPRRRRAALTAEVLKRVGLTHRAEALGRLLSGGEKQRLAIARAVVAGPRVLLADEPTGNLDDDNARAALELFDEQAATGVAIVVITHDSRIAEWADRTYTIVDGHIGALELEKTARGYGA